MTPQPDHPTRRTTDDGALLASARTVRDGLTRRPFVMGFLAIFAAALLFWLGTVAGEATYLAFDDGLVATTFVGTSTTILIALVAVGAWLDRRRRQRDAEAGPLDDAQRARLRSYAQPASALVRWYQPVAVAVFFALAVPGAYLLATPWDGLWVLAVLIANPVTRWLRARGHVLRIRELGFRVPGLSPWPAIATAAVATVAAMAFTVLLEAGMLDTTPATIATNLVLVALIVGGTRTMNHHRRRHIARLLDGARA